MCYLCSFAKLFYRFLEVLQIHLPQRQLKQQQHSDKMLFAKSGVWATGSRWLLQTAFQLSIERCGTEVEWKRWGSRKEGLLASWGEEVTGDCQSPVGQVTGKHLLPPSLSHTKKKRKYPFMNDISKLLLLKEVRKCGKLKPGAHSLPTLPMRATGQKKI